jgi:anti-sigma B factor antagonist
VDGREIRYISSAGLGVFISYLEELAIRGGRFVVSGLADNVRDVFQILGLDKLDHLVLTDAAPQDDQLFAANP